MGGHDADCGLRRPRQLISTTPRRCSTTATGSAPYRKRYLPNYGVFDEDRYFMTGREGPRFPSAGADRGHACARTSGTGRAGKIQALAGAGALIIINVSASTGESSWNAGACSRRARWTTSPGRLRATWSAGRTKSFSTAAA